MRVPNLDFAADPLPNLHDVLAELRETEPVSRVQFAGKPIWLVNDYETVSRHLSTDEVLSAPAAIPTWRCAPTRSPRSWAGCCADRSRCGSRPMERPDDDADSEKAGRQPCATR
jgi:hypothetical protein